MLVTLKTPLKNLKTPDDFQQAKELIDHQIRINVAMTRAMEIPSEILSNHLRSSHRFIADNGP